MEKRNAFANEYCRFRGDFFCPNNDYASSSSLGLLFATNWTAGAAGWQTLNGGKISARNPSVPAPPSLAAVSSVSPAARNTETTKLEAAFNVKAWPNPTEQQFNLRITGSSTEAVFISVTDIMGRKVYATEGLANKDYQFGQNFKIGMYLVEIRQGKLHKTLKLVKQ